MTLSIEITSDVPVKVGSIIIGSVLCNFSKPKNVKEIQVQFYGEENTLTYLTNLILSGSNVLVNTENKLIDSETELPSGTSEYAFRINVPSRLPSSYECSIGGIKYFLKAIVKTQFRRWTAKKNIEMVSYVDLNTFLPALQLKAEYSIDRVVSNLCGLSRGSIMLNAIIDKRLFARGETINLAINIINLSGVRVSKVHSRIMQTVTIYFLNPYPEDSTFRDFVAKSMNFPGVKGYDETSYDLHMEVPSDLFIPNFKHSKLFKITFQLQVIATLSGCNTNMILQFKIYLGHIPYSYDRTRNGHLWKGPFIRGPNTPSSSTSSVSSF